MLEKKKSGGTLPNKIPNEFPFDIWVFPKNRGYPQIIPCLIGFSIIFTIHFGGKPLFLVQHPYVIYTSNVDIIPFQKSL